MDLSLLLMTPFVGAKAAAPQPSGDDIGIVNPRETHVKHTNWPCSITQLAIYLYSFDQN